MKTVFLLLSLLVAVHARPQQRFVSQPQQLFPERVVPSSEAQLVEFDRKEPDQDGNSGVYYLTDHGIEVSAITQKDEFGQHSQTGSYSYLTPDGQRVRVSYVADEDGYWPQVEVPQNYPAHALEQIRRGQEEHARAREHNKRLRAQQRAARRVVTV